MVQDEVTEHKCPVCGKPMLRKNGRFGSFLGCSDYPTCKTTLRLDKEGNPLPPKEKPESTGIKCHKCKTGELVLRKSKRGPFLGCNRFAAADHREYEESRPAQGTPGPGRMAPKLGEGQGNPGEAKR
jgi:ssDNA-binding Zn-finger/Zn-ribbon topoisomerase 1